jgi:hypothetical protein
MTSRPSAERSTRSKNSLKKVLVKFADWGGVKEVEKGIRTVWRWRR